VLERNTPKLLSPYWYYFPVINIQQNIYLWMIYYLAMNNNYKFVVDSCYILTNKVLQELSLSVQVWTSKTTYCKPGTRVMFIISDMCYYSPRDLFLCFHKKRVRYMASFQISGCKYLCCFGPCHGRINTKWPQMPLDFE